MQLLTGVLFKQSKTRAADMFSCWKYEKHIIRLVTSITIMSHQRFVKYTKNFFFFFFFFHWTNHSFLTLIHLICYCWWVHFSKTRAIDMFYVNNNWHVLCKQSVKHLSADPSIFPWGNVAMGGAKLIIAKHMACHVTKHSLDSQKENMLSLFSIYRSREGILLHTAATDKTRR